MKYLHEAETGEFVGERRDTDAALDLAEQEAKKRGAAIVVSNEQGRAFARIEADGRWVDR